MVKKLRASSLPSLSKLAKKKDFNAIKNILLDSNLPLVELEKWLNKCGGGSPTTGLTGRLGASGLALGNGLFFDEEDNSVLNRGGVVGCGGGCYESIFGSVNNPINRNSNNNHTTALHVVIENDPPSMELVELLMNVLIKLSPDVSPEQVVDSITLKTPLHIAAENGCDSHIVSRLLNGITGVYPATLQDWNGFFPLHSVCYNYSSESGSKSNKHPPSSKRTTISSTLSTASITRKLLSCTMGGNSTVVDQEEILKAAETSASNTCGVNSKKKIDNMVKIVDLLLVAFPKAVCMVDHKGYTPLDYAKENNADQRIITALEDVQELYGGYDNRITTTSNTDTDDEDVICIDSTTGGRISGGGFLFNKSKKNLHKKKKKKPSGSSTSSASTSVSSFGNSNDENTVPLEITLCPSSSSMPGPPHSSMDDFVEDTIPTNWSY